MDAFGNDLPSANSFLDMDQPGPKEHLTGKMFDTTTGLYYFHARWYDPQVGRFLSRDRVHSAYNSPYVLAHANVTNLLDPDGSMPRSGHKELCPIWDLVSEWYNIVDWAREGNRTNNSQKHIACGMRARVIAKAITRHKLCCYDIAVMTRKKYKLFPLPIHTVTVVRVKAFPANSWVEPGNEVIDDWQVSTVHDGQGDLLIYDMNIFLFRYPVHFDTDVYSP